MLSFAENLLEDFHELTHAKLLGQIIQYYAAEVTRTFGLNVFVPFSLGMDVATAWFKETV